MVHLGKVATDKEVKDELAPGLERLSFNDPPAEDEFTSSVYGSKYAAADLPKHEMPEGEMPREVAYRMIKDDLTLDGTPTLK
jgi:glutamate decarboxylase